MESENSQFLERFADWLEKKGGSKFLGALIPVLLIISLLLPPISLGTRVVSAGYRSIPVKSGGSVADPDGTQVTFPSDGLTGSIHAKLSSVPREIFLKGKDEKGLQKAVSAIPKAIVMKSPLYKLSVKGPAPKKVIISVPIPNNSEPFETLDLYAWNGTKWVWMPSKLIKEDEVLESHLGAPVEYFAVFQTKRQPQMAGLFWDSKSGVPKEGSSVLSYVFPLSYSLKDDEGDLETDFSPDALAKAENASYTVVPVIRNWREGKEGGVSLVRTDLVDNTLKSEKASKKLVDNIVELTVSGLYPGVVLDFRNVDVNLKGEFSAFVQSLAKALHDKNKQLAVRVDTPRQISEDRFDTGAYDWTVIGEYADTVIVGAPVDPMAYKPGGPMDQLAIWSVGHVQRQKLHFVLPGRSVERAGDYYLLLPYDRAVSPLLGKVEVEGEEKPGAKITVAMQSERILSPLRTDPALHQKWFSYKDNSGKERIVWLEDAESLKYKLSLISRYNVSGVDLDYLPGSAGSQKPIWNLLNAFVQDELDKFAVSEKVEVVFQIKDGDKVVASVGADLQNPKATIKLPDKVEKGLSVEASIAVDNNVVSSPVAAKLAVAATGSQKQPQAPSPAATPTPAPTPAGGKGNSSPVLTTNDPINLRSGPGTAYPAKGKSEPGKEYKIVGKNKDGTWWQIEVGGQKLWISAKYSNATGDLAKVAVVQNIPKPPARPAAAPAPRAAAGFFDYGIQAHMVDNDQAPRVMAAINDLGFHWVKQQVEWKRFEPSKGNYQWGPLDYIVNVAQQHGVKVMFSVAKAPRWARPANADFSVEGPPANPQDFGNFMGALAKRYCGRVGAVEAWNEQNINYEWGNEPPDPGRYIQLLAAAYRAVKAACPQMIVISGALTPAGNVTIGGQWRAVDDVNYLTAMYQHGLKNYCDAVGAHPSGFNVAPWVHGGAEACNFITQRHARFRGPCNSPHHSWSFRSTMEMYRNIMVRFGDANKRIWPTEFGWASSDTPAPGYEYAADNSKQDQAEWTVKAYQMMKAWGWVGVAFLWNLNFGVVAPGSEMAQWGIVDQYWHPYPVYIALKNMRK